MSAFRYGGVASIFCLCYTAVVLIAEAPSYYNKYIDNAKIEPFIFNLDLPTGMCMAFFAY
jgi:hypothetical protein